MSEAHRNHKPHATHLTHATHVKKAAFTLAEVLITLGIIGIVAAMTIPTLIANYDKKQALTRLKQTYSIISQALTMAQAEHGDMSTWDCWGFSGRDTNDPNINPETAITSLAQTYLIPYVKVAEDYEYTTYKNIGYDGFYNPSSNTIEGAAVNSKYIFSLSNGVLTSISLNTTGCKEYNDDDECIRREYTNFTFWIDINGFNKPNTLGKDVFAFVLNDGTRKLDFYKYTGEYTRNQYLNHCKSDAWTCGYIIFIDSWQIKDDYPWL